MGTILAALNVAYRDFRYVIPFLLQMWMFATPTVYMQPGGGSGLTRAALMLNPLSSLIAAFRSACCGGPIDWARLWPAAVVAPILFVASCLFFRRMEHNFADII